MISTLFSTLYSYLQLTTYSGDGNKFGNGNNIGSGDNGIKIGRKVSRTETLGTYIGNIVDDATVPLEPGSSDSIWGSPSNNGNHDGDNNEAGSHNDGNGSGE